MNQRSEYGEGHPERICCYCGNLADTVDHVPSKVFLDKPYPENLPVVPCCKRCNEEFAFDEEYVAVLLECLRWQTFNPEEFKREKVRKIVEHNPAILKTVRESVRTMSDDEHFTIQSDNVRLRKVLTKLIAGHLRFEGLDQLFLHDGLEIRFYQAFVRIVNSMIGFIPQSTRVYYLRWEVEHYLLWLNKVVLVARGFKFNQICMSIVSPRIILK